MHAKQHNPTKQQGFVLILSLIFMVVLTTIGLGLSSSSTDEERMSRNFRDQEIALAAAEAALRDAELRISGAWKYPYDQSITTISFSPACSDGLCNATEAPSIPICATSPTSLAMQADCSYDFYSSTAPGSNSAIIGNTTGTPLILGMSNTTTYQPRYMIEQINTVFGDLGTPTIAYRITAQGRGRLENTRVTLQEIYLPAKNTVTTN